MIAAQCWDQESFDVSFLKRGMKDTCNVQAMLSFARLSRVATGLSPKLQYSIVRRDFMMTMKAIQ